MEQKDFYEVNGCTDFIPVKFIEEHKHMTNTLNVELTETGNRTFVPHIYSFPKVKEPQKVVVPKFVADKIEYCKKTGEYGLYNAMNYCYRFKESSGWLECNQETFALAWLDGYEIEQEKLYTVEIPNPNLNAHTILQKTENGIVLIEVSYARWKGWEWRGWENSKLTEAEIKKDFEWAFQFAKPVEE